MRKIRLVGFGLVQIDFECFDDTESQQSGTDDGCGDGGHRSDNESGGQDVKEDADSECGSDRLGGIATGN